MKHEIDIDRLRADMEDDFGTAMFNASPMAVMDLAKVESMSARELVEFADKHGVDLADYIDE